MFAPELKFILLAHLITKLNSYPSPVSLLVNVDWSALLRAICRPCKTTSEAMMPIDGANLVARTWNCCHYQLDISLAWWCDTGPLWLLFPVITTSSVSFSYLNPPPTPSTFPTSHPTCPHATLAQN